MAFDFHHGNAVKSLKRLWIHHPLYIHIASVFTLLVFLAGTLIGWGNYFQGRSIALAGAEEVFERMQRESRLEAEHLRVPAEAVIDWLSAAPLTEATTLNERLEALRAMARVLDKQLHLTAVYIGYDNGHFFLVRALRDDADRALFKAPAAARYLAQHIESGDGGARFMMFDGAFTRVHESTPTDFKFDARTRPWYIDAQKSDEIIHTAPYVFFTTGKVGVTIARRASNQRAVVGVDLRLTRISEALAKSRMSPSSQLAVFSAEGFVIGHSGSSDIGAAGTGGSGGITKIANLPPVLALATATPDDYRVSRMVTAGGREWLVKVVHLAHDAKGNQLVVAVPRDELLAKADTLLARGGMLTLLIILFAVPLTWLISRRIAGNLRALTDQAAAIRRFDFSTPFEVRTRIDEIHGLGRAMTQMKETIRKFLEIATALSGERNFDVLLQRVLKEALDAAGGEGAVAYLCDEDQRVLMPSAQYWAGKTSVLLTPLPMAGADNPVTRVLNGDRMSRLHRVAVPRPAGIEYLDTAFGESTVPMVTVPLHNRAGQTIGVLCIFMPTGAAALSPERIALVEAFAGAGAAAIDNQRLLQAQKALLESFIGLVARAIDAKSPYTYGHCQRVPELTKMLARAACDAKTGPFAGFDLSSEQWEALHIAGWLHDCGKVTTPEYVVDKATKLETIFDRIHLVRMRFEVLKRDAEIACLKKIVAGGDAVAAQAEKDAAWRTLDEEFAFVALCNEGGEFLAPDKVERLKSIASRTWSRTLDDRLGVSWEEAERMASSPKRALPAVETLLADKPEHIIERREQDVIAADNPWGFKLKVPEHKYNRGELYNLAISRGTLSEEERYMINDHIVQSIIMLSELPFPEHLKPVPELAGGHHEKMDGTGYPKQLAHDDMSVQARIMAIADIFEALTASDRPYKKAKKLSEAVKIMSFMKKDQHIDAELFELFLTSGVYRQFAEKYLEPQYIDDVDINAYVPVKQGA
jgi:HD-GYP domain-containing protein (c-di-GMP phosphodiesterase class II)/HAMP domain-containing protein